MILTMRVTSKGQVTIPKGVREEAGLLPGSEVEFAIEDGEVKIRRARRQPSQSEELVGRLRAGRAQFSMTTEEVMALTRGGN